MANIWRNIDKTSSVCWLWLGNVHSNGYGTFNKVQAHRVVFERITKTKISPSRVLHHICENKTCVYPGHLQVLTREVHNFIHYHKEVNGILDTIEITTDKFQTFLSGIRVYTIREGHRVYEKSLKIRCGDYLAGGVLNSYTHTHLVEVPFFILKEEGFRNISEALSILKIFYPNITLESNVTVVEFRLAI